MLWGRENQTGKELSLGREKIEGGKRNILAVMETVRLTFALLNPGSSMLDLGDQVLEPSKRLYYEVSGCAAPSLCWPGASECWQLPGLESRRPTLINGFYNVSR